MFIIFEVLIRSTEMERVEMAVSSAKEAVSVIWLLTQAPTVIAFKMSQYSPRDLGMSPNESWSKYRKEIFTQQDYQR